MAKKPTTKITAIPAPSAFYAGSGTYVFTKADGQIAAGQKISGDCIHPSCVGPDRGDFKTNGGAAYDKAAAFAASAGGECFLAVGSSFELLHVTPFK